jgi:hypothetical protein
MMIFLVTLIDECWVEIVPSRFDVESIVDKLSKILLSIH